MSLASWWKKTGVYAVLKHGMKGITYKGIPVFSEDGIFGDAAKGLANSLNNAVAGVTGTRLTDAQREKISTETEAQNWLDEQDYDRKIDFYERFESPAAQVAQYKAAGINPALMYQSAPGVSASGGVGAGSAGSAGDSGVDVGSLLALLGNMANIKANFDLRTRQMDIEKSLGEQRIALDKYKTDAQIDYWKTLAGESESRTILNGVKVRQAEADVKTREILNWYLPSQQEKELAQKDALTREAEERILSHQKERELMDAKLTEIAAKVALLNSEVTLNSHRSKEILQRIENMKEEYKLIGKKIGLADKDIEFYAFNHARVVQERGGLSIFGTGFNVGTGELLFPGDSVPQRTESTVTRTEKALDEYPPSNYIRPTYRQ